jgi:transcriptional regulator with XRE-family HTH domain
MQAVSDNSKTDVYHGGMSPAGRPATKDRTELGSRIAEARQTAGLTQQELADKLGVTQRVIAYWEREAVSIRADQIDALSSALKITADDLLGRKAAKARGAGPASKTRRLFEAVSKMPRHQQDKIVAILEPFVAQHMKA